jgi:AcrR family transcriptional regulator
VARTPSKEAHEKVLNATLRLIGERGIEVTSMDAIAYESGVSKATMYKHWANRDALLIDVLRSHSDKLPEFDTGNPREDMVQFVRYLAEARKRQELGPVWPKIIGYAMSNPQFAKAMREFAFEPRRAQVRRILGRAIGSGELRHDTDTDLATDLLIGPIMHRRFISDALPPDLPKRVVDYFWDVFRRRP